MDESRIKAIEKYRRTEKGKTAFRKAHEKYVQTPEGKEAQNRASQKFEEINKEARREYKRLKAREYSLKKKQQSAAS